MVNRESFHFLVFFCFSNLPRKWQGQEKICTEYAGLLEVDFNSGGLKTGWQYKFEFIFFPEQQYYYVVYHNYPAIKQSRFRDCCLSVFNSFLR